MNEREIPKRLILLDGHALLFRAYHAMPGFTAPDGRPTGAVYGFSNVLIRVLRELEPRWVVACFDSAGKTFREEVYTEYKATRAETPADIITQEPIVREVLTAFGVPSFALAGLEADDLIATLVTQALQGTNSPVEEVVVVTGDRDLLQLSRPGVKIYLLRQSIKEITLLDEAAVTELMSLPPTEILEWKALRGDPSDNISGVPGVGDKTALALITQFHTLERLYAAIDQNDSTLKLSDRIRGSLIEYRDRAFQNRDLMTVRYDAPIELNLAAADRTHYRRDAALTILRELGFKNILTRLPEDVTRQQASLF